MLVTPAGLVTALRRADDYLLAAPLLEALLARREAGLAASDDEEITAELAAELTSDQADDGSWGSNVARTADALLLLGALLGDSQRSEAASRAVSWLRRRQNRPGGFAAREMCEPDLHAALVCQHATSGFFSPAGPQVSLVGYALENGLRFTSDRDARLGISALTLQAVLRWSDATEEDRKHIDALIRIADSLFRPGRVALAGPAAAVAVLTTLAVAPRTPDLTVSLYTALSRLATTQRGDGSWSELDSTHVADLLLLAIRRGYSSPAFDAALLRTAEQLTFSQKANGAWGRTVDPYRTLIGWRVLRYVTGRQPQAKLDA